MKNRSAYDILQRPASVCVRSISEAAPLQARMQRGGSENCSNAEPLKANGRMRMRTSRACLSTPAVNSLRTEMGARDVSRASADVKAHLM